MTLEPEGFAARPINLDPVIADALARRPETVPDERTFALHMRALEHLLGPDWETEFTASTWARVRRADANDSGVVAIIGRQLPLAIRIGDAPAWPEHLDRWLAEHNYVVIEAPSWREPVFSVDPQLLARALEITDITIIEQDLAGGPFSVARLWFVTD
jgi:hypothetical protein